ncbi:MarR family winged helix-turn-helix transcriptional regulator [Specibacter sp. RAF43]|uniref:MarR family winged helix-turn-helix transcriptional regulator n=1 Tax=Specibacter sp. RAF43 TaxID=3233057 RepID=UPI003F972F08
MAIQPAGTPRRTAFLLSQLGSLSAARFAQRTKELGLTPSDAGTLRLLGHSPGLSQRSLADRLGAVPSRVVPLIDSLEARGLVARARSSTDRRNYELHLTNDGRAMLRRLRAVAVDHEEELLAALTPAQSAELGRLLALLADGNQVDREIHRDPGGPVAD